MASNAEVTKRWFEVAPNHSRMIGRGWSNTVRPSSDGRELYSYGSHFPMVRAMLGKDGTPSWWLLNGDRFSVTTSRHQRDVLSEATGTGLPVLIVPFSALASAGIIQDSISIIEVTPDTWTEIDRSSDSLSDVPRHLREEYVSGVCTADCPQYGEPYVGRTYPPNATHTHSGITRDKQRGQDGRYHWTTNEHRLGSAVFSARYAFDRPARSMCRGPFDETGSQYRYVSGQYVDVETAVCRHGHPVAHRPTIRETGRADFLSGFDMQESPPLYFLAQLPKAA